MYFEIQVLERQTVLKALPLCMCVFVSGVCVVCMFVLVKWVVYVRHREKNDKLLHQTTYCKDVCVRVHVCVSCLDNESWNSSHLSYYPASCHKYSICITQCYLSYTHTLSSHLEMARCYDQTRRQSWSHSCRLIGWEQLIGLSDEPPGLMAFISNNPECIALFSLFSTRVPARTTYIYH